MRRKPKFLLAFAIAIITFGSLKVFVPKEFQDNSYCRHTSHCGSHFENHNNSEHFDYHERSKTEIKNNLNGEE